MRTADKWMVGIAVFLALALVAAYVGKVLAADEFDIVGELRLKNGNFQQSRARADYTPDQSTLAVDMGVISVVAPTTNYLPINSATTPYYCWFENLETNNNISITLTIKLRPGDFALVPVANTNIQYFTDTGTNRLDYWVNSE